jgi:hypothetical protein
MYIDKRPLKHKSFAVQLGKCCGDYYIAIDNAQARGRGMHAATARLADIEEGIVSDAFTARLGPSATPVLDEDKMSKLIALMGPEWVAGNLPKYAIEVERRLASLDAATSSELAVIAHALMGMAGYCGFMELLDVLEDVQREARKGAGLNRIPELRAAGDRALAVMRSYTPRP